MLSASAPSASSITCSGQISIAFAIISDRGNHFPSGVVHRSTSPNRIASDICRRVHPRSAVACEMLTCGRGCRKM